MKKLFCFICVVISMQVNAQINNVSLQASGLTCSMCSRSIYKAIKSLDFVKDVESNIKNSSFDISFKPGSKINFDQIKKKVEEAGFFVANFKATMHFNHVAIINDSHATIDGIVFHFLNVKDQLLQGDKIIILLDKGFVSSKVYKKNSKLTLMECYKTGMAENCCAKDGLIKGTRVFHVTI